MFGRSIVTTDATIHCHLCAYDLRVTPRDGVCPECGTPVAEAVAASMPLRIAAPRASRLAAVGCAVMLLGGLMHIGHWLGLSRNWPEVLWRVWFDAGFYLTMLGPFFLLARLPGEATRRRAMIALVLATAILLLLAQTIVWEIYTIDGVIEFPPWLEWQLDDRVSVATVWLLILPISLIAWLRLARIAGRLPSRWSPWVGRGMGIACVIAVAEPTLNVVVFWNDWSSGGNAPVFIMPFTIGTMWRALHGNPSVRGGFRGLAEIGFENGWLSSLIFTPLAYAAMIWFTFILARAAWSRGEPGGLRHLQQPAGDNRVGVSGPGN